MNSSSTNRYSSFLSATGGVAAGFLALFVATAPVCYADGDHDRGRPRNVPSDLQVPTGNVLAFHATGVGVQIYVWTVSSTGPASSSWVLKAPHAVLFHREEHLSGIHFAGPTWEANDGSKVVGARVAASAVDPNAIPWLLLRATGTAGTGLFAEITYIQRLNTVGGLAPSTPGTSAGEEVLVPYIADYYFYHAN